MYINVYKRFVKLLDSNYRAFFEIVSMPSGWSPPHVSAVDSRGVAVTEFVKCLHQTVIGRNESETYAIPMYLANYDVSQLQTRIGCNSLAMNKETCPLRLEDAPLWQ